MKIILGTMTFSDQVDQSVASSMLSAFRQTPHDEIDTAFVYNKGETEQLLGRLQIQGELAGTRIAGKANPAAENGLTPDSVRTQLNTSLKRLQLESLDLFYLHAPDLSVPIRQTLQAVAELHEQGKFKRFGLSNYAAWQVAEVVEICDREGWIKPSVYQGMYNALTRDVERELLLCLRHYNLAFYAYNPLAGGMLSGKHLSMETVPDSGRFATFNGYQERYWKPEYFTVIDQIATTCREAHIEPAAAAIRWLIHHSELANDQQSSLISTDESSAAHGIILGASSMTHLSQNLQATLDGALPEVVVDAFSTGWNTVRPACIKYFRP